MANARYDEAIRALDGVSKSMKRISVATGYLSFMMTIGGDAFADVRSSHRTCAT